MSTKTSFKRIALVAVAGMVSGLVSVAPASAAITYAAATPFSVKVADSGVTADLTTVSNTLTASQVAGVSNYVQIEGGANLASGIAVVSVSGSNGYIKTKPGAWADNSSTGVKATITTSANATITGDLVDIGTPTAGTVTVTISKRVDNGTGSFTDTLLQTLTITVTAAGVSGVANVSASAAVVLANSAVKTSYDDYAEISGGTNLTSAVDGRVSGVASALIAGIIRDAVGGAIDGATVSMSVSGPGTISASQAATGDALADGGKADSITTAANGLYYGRLYSDGTSGVATVTIKVGATTFATKKVTFFGTATAISAKQNLYNAPAAGLLGQAHGAADATGADVANTYAATIKVTDALGNPAVGTVSALSSNTAVIGSAACTASSVTAGTYNCEVNGANGATVGSSATVTWQVLLADGVTKASAAPRTFKIGGTAAKATVAPAAAAYLPGSLVTLTVTVTDALGNAAADADTNIFGAGIKSSVALTKDWTLAGAGEVEVAVINGVAKLTFYAPLTAGPVVIDLPVESAFDLSGTITKLTTTVNVSESASIAAITTLINSLIAKINALNKLVIKIQKKVRA
jgi:hypothetical protein